MLLCMVSGSFELNSAGNPDLSANHQQINQRSQSTLQTVYNILEQHTTNYSLVCGAEQSSAHAPTNSSFMSVLPLARTPACMSTACRTSACLGRLLFLLVLQTRASWDQVLARCVQLQSAVSRLVCLGQACTTSIQP